MKETYTGIFINILVIPAREGESGDPVATSGRGDNSYGNYGGFE